MVWSKVINQPFNGQLGNYLIETLEQNSFESLNIAVAFAKNSGVLRLKKAIETFRDNGGEVNVYVGIDLGGTSYEALTTLLSIVDSLYIVHVESDQTFHPKIYNFKAQSETVVIIGSQNMTGGGLWTNIESSTVLTLNLADTSDRQTQTEVDEYFAMLSVVDTPYAMKVENQEIIDRLKANHYVENEVLTRIHKQRAENSEASKGNPGTGRTSYFTSSIKAPLPALAMQAKPANRNSRQKEARVFQPQTERASSPAIKQDKVLVSQATSESYDIFWFETRALTGGSRNILDLSMKAIIEAGDPTGTEYAIDEPGMMKGGVQFFGVDPVKETQEIDVTINYEGIDYEGNTIKFPKGDKANGTWRLQIKGVDGMGNPITSAFERDYLKNKILAFTKVADDYYFMTVFPDSDLQEFIESSRVVAHNGSNNKSKYFGLL